MIGDDHLPYFPVDEAPENSMAALLAYQDKPAIAKHAY